MYGIRSFHASFHHFHNVSMYVLLKTSNELIKFIYKNANNEKFV